MVARKRSSAAAAQEEVEVVENSPPQKVESNGAASKRFIPKVDRHHADEIRAEDGSEIIDISEDLGDDDSSIVEVVEDDVITHDMLEEEQHLLEAHKDEEEEVWKENPAPARPNQAMFDVLLAKATQFSSFLEQQLIADQQQKTEATAAAAAAAAEEKQGPQSKKRRTKAEKVAEGQAKMREMDEDGGKSSKGPQMAISQPSLVTGVTMRDYQLEGVSWLESLFQNGMNGILADEMGLGKTLQTIALLAHLIQMGISGPFLVVAPLSTLSNWLHECQRFCPTIRAMIYHGTKEERALKREEIRPLDGYANKMPIVITSFEVAINDRRFLQQHTWKYLVVDEGHRLKNRECLLFKELKALHSENRLLLTGTPLQNNLGELWSLLNFLLPQLFADQESFLSWFEFAETIHKNRNSSKEQMAILQEERQSRVVSSLHRILKPFVLRRMKEDVSLDLPPKREIVVYANLSERQREITKHILDSTLKQWMKENSLFHNVEVSTNIGFSAIQLRKVCNHPYLFAPKVDDGGEFLLDESLVDQSGKMALLDRMLTILHQNGHRVLIFSQMKRMLDFIEDLLEMRGYNYSRLDGSTRHSERQEMITDFNRKDSDKFCFLLTTRAGGLGINLPGADTVILYDSDWNPQVDLQAQDRAHRIGQTKPVGVYRLVSENSIETSVFSTATAKRTLEKIVINRKKFSSAIDRSEDVSTDELASVLRAAHEACKKVKANENLIPDSELEMILTCRGDLARDHGAGWRINQTTVTRF